MMAVLKGWIWLVERQFKSSEVDFRIRIFSV